jgi:hypothetical protein
MRGWSQGGRLLAGKRQIGSVDKLRHINGLRQKAIIEHRIRERQFALTQELGSRK